MSKQSVHPVFERFLVVCEREFGFLVDVHGFTRIEAAVHGHECSVVYRKLPNAALRVTYEDGSTPWVVASLRLDPESEKPESFQISLHLLARKCIKGWKPKSFRDPNEAQIREVLHSYSALLREHFPEILEAKDGVGRDVKKRMAMGS